MNMYKFISIIMCVILLFTVNLVCYAGDTVTVKPPTLSTQDNSTIHNASTSSNKPVEKRFSQDKEHAKLLGVCSGIARYFNIDTTLVRLGFCLFTLAGGAGIAVYIICAIVMPNE